MITTTYLLHLNEPLSMYNLLDLHPEHNHHKLGLIMSNNKLLETILKKIIVNNNNYYCVSYNNYYIIIITFKYLRKQN